MSIDDLRVVDLTQPFHPGLVMWPGSPAPEFETVVRIDPDGFFARRITFVEHSGTHFDAPAHMVAGTQLLHEVDPATLIRPLAVIDISDDVGDDPDAMLSEAQVVAFEAAHGRIPDRAMVFLRTGWEERNTDPVAYAGQPGRSPVPGLRPRWCRVPGGAAPCRRPGRGHPGHRPRLRVWLRGPSHGQPPQGRVAPGGSPEPEGRAAAGRMGVRWGAAARGRVRQPGACPRARAVADTEVPGVGHGPVCDGPNGDVNETLDQVRLVDHHVHSILPGRLDAPTFMSLLTESDRPAAIEVAGWDSQLGIAIRRWCAPLLGLDRHVPPATYLSLRLALTNEDAARTFLPAAGVSDLLVDTGIRPGQLLELGDLGRLAGARPWTIVRLEWLAERIARSGVDAAGYADAFRSALHAALESAIGCKTIVAYRFGLDFDPEPPTASAVADAAGSWLRTIATSGSARLSDPVLLRFGIWEAIRAGRPLQIHVGYGDTDLELQRADPALLTRFLRATEALCPVMLLHTYPFQRTAGYLAQVFGHVYVDVGLAVHHTGAASEHIIRESLELAPLPKVLFSSDAWGLPELHLLGSWLFRRGLSRVLGAWVDADDWSLGDAQRAIEGIARHNAIRVYGLASGT